jgi:hypothetical protein
MMYTDSTGLDGGKQYAIRSTDPTFQSGVQTATADGFVAQTSANKASYVVSQSYSADMQYSDALGDWIVLSNQGSGHTYVRFLSADFSHKVRDDLSIADTWVEGPGLSSTPDKHSLPHTGSDCARISVDFVNASAKTSGGNPTGLRHYGQDVLTDTGCAGLDPSTVAAMYDGYIIEASGMPATFVTKGVRLQSASFPPLQDLTNSTVDVTTSVFDRIPYGGSLQVGATAIGASGKPGAFLLDHDTIWPVNALKLITDNKSSLTTVSVASYDTHTVGPALYLVQ